MSKLFEGMICVLSGTLSLPHVDLSSLITSNGGVVASDVTSQTTHLISTPLDIQKGSVKTTRAKQLNLPIIGESFIHASLKEQKREPEAVHIITADTIIPETAQGTEEGGLNGTPKPGRRGRGAKKKEPSLISGPVHSVYKVDMKRLQQDVVPSAEFSRLWKESTRLDVPPSIGPKIEAHVDEELLLSGAAEVSSTTKSEDEELIPKKRIIRTEIEENIWAILNKIKVSTHRMEVADEFGIWKRAGDLRLTFVNLQMPNRFVHVFAKERFNITEKNSDFKSTLLVEILLADVNEQPEKWVSWITKPQSSGKTATGSLCYPIFYSSRYLELNNGAQAFSKTSKAFHEAAQFLQLNGFTFPHCLKKALLNLVQPELNHREDEYQLWYGPNDAEDEDDEDEDEEDEGDIESWELSDDDEPPRKRKKNDDKGWKSDDNEDEDDDDEYNDDDDDDDYY